jgi:hypothetical protein
MKTPGQLAADPASVAETLRNVMHRNTSGPSGKNDPRPQPDTTNDTVTAALADVTFWHGVIHGEDDDRAYTATSPFLDAVGRFVAGVDPSRLPDQAADVLAALVYLVAQPRAAVPDACRVIWRCYHDNAGGPHTLEGGADAVLEAVRLVHAAAPQAAAPPARPLLLEIKGGKVYVRGKHVPLKGMTEPMRRAALCILQHYIDADGTPLNDPELKGREACKGSCFEHGKPDPYKVRKKLPEEILRLLETKNPQGTRLRVDRP